MKQHYNRTLYACFTGYVVQAIVNNFAPLLFLTFQKSYGIPLTQITLLVTINFMLQLVIDLISISFVDRIGYRISAVIAHVCAAAGLISLTVLPEMTQEPFVGIMISVIIYAVGGGLLEVLVSPIVEACPTENKEKAMSLLHSFYCWGHVAVVLFSTVFFYIVGIQNWKVLALLWAIIPLLNSIAFAKVPIAPLIDEEETGLKIGELCKNKVFWIMMIFMVCAGASEQGVSQWASTFAEKGLSVSKTIGDLAGPMFFAIMMGSSRAIYGKFGDRIDLYKFMTLSCILCILSYLLTSLSPNPVLSLLGCGLCGLSVGIMWPGSFSIASASIPRGGTALFALLALAGDLGCSSGPTVVGFAASAFGDNLRNGILVGTVFPVLLLAGLYVKRKTSV
ncbi:MAG: MFS transporter [Lachnospiraceae bacterium]|jgi:MFS family permease|nr:MFS transporter [Lachnospiraceae bacterium]